MSRKNRKNQSRRRKKDRGRRHRRSLTGAAQHDPRMVELGPVWEVGALPLSVSCDPLGLYRLLLVVDQSTEMVLGCQPAPNPVAGSAIRSLVEGACRSPTAPATPRSPERLLVDSSGTAEALEPLRARYGFAIDVSERLDVARRVARAFNKGAPALYNPDFLGVRHLEAELLALADRFAGLAPWEALFCEEALVIEVPGKPLSHSVGIVLGGGGEIFGMSLYRSEEELSAVRDSDDPGPAPGSLPDMDVMTVFFDDSHEIPEPVRRAYASYGYTRTDRFPYFTRLRRGRAPRSLNKREARDMRVALGAVGDFLEAHGNALRYGERDLNGTYQTHDGRAATVTLKPRPGAPTLWPDDTPFFSTTQPAIDWIGPSGEYVFSSAVLDERFLSAVRAKLRAPIQLGYSNLGDRTGPLPGWILKTYKADARRVAPGFRGIDSVALLPPPFDGALSSVLALGRGVPIGIIAQVDLEDGRGERLRRDVAQASGRLLLVLSAGGVNRSRDQLRVSEIVLAREVELLDVPPLDLVQSPAPAPRVDPPAASRQAEIRLDP